MSIQSQLAHILKTIPGISTQSSVPPSKHNFMETTVQKLSIAPPLQFIIPSGNAHLVQILVADNRSISIFFNQETYTFQLFKSTPIRANLIAIIAVLELLKNDIIFEVEQPLILKIIGNLVTANQEARNSIFSDLTVQFCLKFAFKQVQFSLLNSPKIPQTSHFLGDFTDNWAGSCLPELKNTSLTKIDQNSSACQQAFQEVSLDAVIALDLPFLQLKNTPKTEVFAIDFVKKMQAQNDTLLSGFRVKYVNEDQQANVIVHLQVYERNRVQINISFSDKESVVCCQIESIEKTRILASAMVITLLELKNDAKIEFRTDCQEFVEIMMENFQEMAIGGLIKYIRRSKYKKVPHKCFDILVYIAVIMKDRSIDVVLSNSQPKIVNEGQGMVKFSDNSQYHSLDIVKPIIVKQPLQQPPPAPKPVVIQEIPSENSSLSTIVSSSDSDLSENFASKMRKTITENYQPETVNNEEMEVKNQYEISISGKLTFVEQLEIQAFLHRFDVSEVKIIKNDEK